jgi:hypothetical protein
MINCLIFSKNRAMQLELLLRSIETNFKEIDKATILFTGDSSSFLEGYNKVKSIYSKYTWIKEHNLEVDIKSILSDFDMLYSLIFVDDEIVVRNQKIEEGMKILKNRPDIHCLSLRMGKNINYTYTTNVASSPPTFETIQSGGINFNVWNWKTSIPSSDWEYPSCINSHIYRTEFLKTNISNISFSNVNKLEETLHTKRNEFPLNMMCFDESKTISVANNLVQNTHKNRNLNDPTFSPKNLNKKFLEKYIIKAEDFYNLDTNTATFEKPYEIIHE